MARYQLLVDAVQISDDLTVGDLMTFLAGCGCEGCIGQLVVSPGRPPSLSLSNPAGKAVAELGDFLVQTPTGLQCCTAAEFEATYTAVTS